MKTERKIVSILQPNYIPWKGYFDLVGVADTFVWLEDVQFTKNDWRNRNQLKGIEGLFWLTVPVRTKDQFGQTIREVEIINSGWSRKHWRAIEVNYQKAPYFSQYAKDLKELYERNYKYLVEVNRSFFDFICRCLQIEVKTISSTELNYQGGSPSERVANICELVGADTYLSGPSARDYINVEDFAKRAIHVEYMSYDNYPEYKQLFSGFVHNVSVLDLVLNLGSRARDFMKFPQMRRSGL